MTDLSTVPTAETGMPVEPSVTLLEHDVDMPEKVLRERGGRYILAGSDSLTWNEVDEAHASLRSRFRQGRCL